jgi:hypothetical protein
MGVSVAPRLFASMAMKQCLKSRLMRVNIFDTRGEEELRSCFRERSENQGTTRGGRRLINLHTY